MHVNTRTPQIVRVQAGARASVRTHDNNRLNLTASPLTIRHCARHRKCAGYTEMLDPNDAQQLRLAPSLAGLD